MLQFKYGVVVIPTNFELPVQIRFGELRKRGSGSSSVGRLPTTEFNVHMRAGQYAQPTYRNRTQSFNYSLTCIDRIVHSARLLLVLNEIRRTLIYELRALV